MSDIMVGIELLVVGLIMVFAVLLFLMYLMKLLNVVVGPQQKAEVQRLTKPPVIVKAELQEDEMIAVLAALSGLLPKDKQAVVRFKATGSMGSPDDEPEIAALIGALTCVVNNSTNQKLVSVKPLV
ncbi:MAG: OadG family protein [Firmicutes bacterium]|nr:OadG family protein [Bacillota bacterium]